MPVILLIEDDNELREMLRTALLRKDYTVVEAANGKEALINFKPSVTDLVVTDLIMPEEDGLKVIMKIKELRPTIKVIAISGGGKAGPGSYLNIAKAMGANITFSKPFSVNDLIASVGKLLKIEQTS